MQTADKLLLFRKGIRPTWEDPRNTIGGNFCLEMKSVKGKEIDQIWKKMVIILTGESWEFSEYVTGIRLVDRQKKYKTFKIEIWTILGCTNTEFSDKVKKELRDKFRVSIHKQLSSFYNFHSEEIFFSDHSKKV